jgi:hypothetical protein
MTDERSKKGADALDSVPSAAEWGRRGLSPAVEKIAYAAAEAFLCDRDEHGALQAPDPAWCARVVNSFSLSLGGCSVQLRLAIPALFRAVDALPPVLIGRYLNMTRLPLDERVRFLDALEHSDNGLFSLLLAGAKVPLTMSAYEEGEALKLTGFDRPSTSTPRRLSLVDDLASVSDADDHAAEKSPEELP